jgi:hypothetical protein
MASVLWVLACSVPPGVVLVVLIVWPVRRRRRLPAEARGDEQRSVSIRDESKRPSAHRLAAGMEGDDMHTKGRTLDPLRYYAYAGTDGAAWDDIVGQPVTHKQYGMGRVMKVVARKGLPSFIHVRFEGSESITLTRRFPTTSFRDGTFTKVLVPNHVASRVPRKGAEGTADTQRLAEKPRSGAQSTRPYPRSRPSAPAPPPSIRTEEPAPGPRRS